jgi:DNA-binding transcriptional LysR family regulator
VNGGDGSRLQESPPTTTAGLVELREVLVFLTLAEELHFARSAQRLGLTPSRVSQTLRSLERKLGGRLLHRTSRRVTLTSFGERFLADAAPVYQQMVHVVERARAANDRLEGILRVGLLFPTAGGPGLAEAIRRFEERHPDCEVQLREVMLDDPLGPLRHGEIDVLAMRRPVDRPDLAVGPTLSCEPAVVQVARDHPLAGRAQVTIEDIADHHVLPLHGWPSEAADAAVPRTTPGGRPIRRRHVRLVPRTLFEVEALVARGEVVHVTVASCAERCHHAELVHVPVTDLPRATTALVWQHRAADPRIRRFVRITEEVVDDPSFTSSDPCPSPARP